jgi:hypothetical protein
LVGIDSNAHHPIWGSPKANARGEVLESFLTENNLHVLNHGNTPTFTRINCATHIDITFTNTSLLPRIVNWNILSEDMMSDHSCLQTSFGKISTHTQCKLNLKKTNWENYTNILTSIDWSLPTINNQQDLDTATSYLIDNVTATVSATTPKIYVTGHHKKDTWWTEALRQMRRDLRSAINTPAYTSLKSNYQKAVRKAKKASWNAFLDRCQSISDTSKLARILTKPKHQPSGLTTKPDGSPTWSNLTSVRNITMTLFPDSTTTSPPSTQPTQPSTPMLTQKIGLTSPL